MTLDEAIQHCEEKAKCGDKCGFEHLQLSKWLKDLKCLKYRINELEAAEYKWFDLVRDFVTVLGNDPYMVYAAIDSHLKIMCDADEIERLSKLNESILDRIEVVKPHEWNRTYTEETSATEKGNK